MKDKLLNIYSRMSSSLRNQSGPGLPASTVAAYNASRGRPHSRHICHAPFTNMYFNVHGDCSPCWLTFHDPDSYPNRSVHEIWFGERFQKLRERLLHFDLTQKCSVCLKNLQTGNHTSVLARAYDVNEIREYPTMLELEVSNTCNLECVMCIGELSSSIRRNREKLPPMVSPYDDAFADQLEEFIPHLHELRFNGGEPFLIPLVYRIFEKVERLHPKLKIVIATNGTVLNNKVKDWLGRLNIHINFSLDSLTADIYETIRVNAKFSRVMENFDHHHAYCRDNGRTMCIMVNPMRNNWHEMPEFVRFANGRNVNLWFNTIHRPKEWAIWSLPTDQLRDVHATLNAVDFGTEARTSIGSFNIGVYRNLADVQLRNWLREAEEREHTAEIATPALTPAEASTALMEKLTVFIDNNFDEGVEQKQNRVKQLAEKLKSIDAKLRERNDDEDFFVNALEVPSDVLYTGLESRSVNSLVEEFENWMVRKAATR
ncbi:MAG: radical SAM protein [Flavobacteriales bacterium]|nr:radical SAM protein [Flavobacteriales bacterium]